MTSWVQRLLIANVLVFFLQQTVPGLEVQLAFIPAFMLARPWTIVTYMFLHANLMHILFNMIALYFFGPRVEQRIGSERFFSLYMISGITGGLLSFIFAPAAPIVGASGAIFGVMAATVLVARQRGSTQIASQFGFLLVINLALSFGISHISVGGHIGGLIGGTICALAILAGERGMLGRNRLALELAAMTAVGVASVLISIAIA